MCFSATCFVSWTEHKHCAFDSLWPNLKLERDTRELVRHTDGRAQLVLLTGFFLSPISLHLPFEQRWTSLRSLQRFSFSTGWLEYPLPHLHMNKMCFRQTWHVLFGSFQWYISRLSATMHDTVMLLNFQVLSLFKIRLYTFQTLLLQHILHFLINLDLRRSHPQVCLQSCVCPVSISKAACSRCLCKHHCLRTMWWGVNEVGFDSDKGELTKEFFLPWSLPPPPFF